MQENNGFYFIPAIKIVLPIKEIKNIHILLLSMIIINNYYESFFLLCFYLKKILYFSLRPNENIIN